jgi:hypothetical protein
VKNRKSTPPSGRKMLRAESPNLSERNSRLSSGISRLSPYEKIQRSDISVRRNDGSTSLREETTVSNPPSQTSCKVPNNLAAVPCLSTNKAATGIASVNSFLRRIDASSMEIGFMFLVETMGIDDACVWAEVLGFSVERPKMLLKMVGIEPRWLPSRIGNYATFSDQNIGSIPSSRVS